MKLIGITGLRGSGKSTIAQYLCESQGWIEMSFADPLKRGIQHMFGLRHEQLFGTDKQKEAVDPYWGVAPRALLQIVGTDLIREQLPTLIPSLYGPIGEGVWIRAAEKRLQEILASPTPPKGIVFSDVRFPDEADFIRRYAGEIWLVQRPGQEHGAWSKHKSEQMAQDPSACPPVVLHNTGTEQELYQHIHTLVSKTPA